MNDSPESATKGDHMFILFALAIGFLPITDESKDDGIKNEAEKLFRQMEEKLEKAKTLECAFEGYIPYNLRSFEGTLFLAEGNKAWLHIKAKNDGIKVQVDNEEARLVIHMVSDGNHQIIHVGGIRLGRPEHRDTPKNLNADSLTWISRSGPMLAFAPVPWPEQKVDSAKDRFLVSDFMLGIKEKIGERDTQRLEYRLSPKGLDGHFAVVVWLDIKTMLPVKRTLTYRDQKHLTENYTKLIIDEKVDPKKFQLPKELPK
jgi:outer membrane lipoprotein-sorting protein